MFRRWVVSVVMGSWKHPLAVVGLALLLAVALGLFAARTLGLDTDESHMISSDLPFRQAEKAMDQAFPGDGDTLVAVIDAPSAAEAEQAVTSLMAALSPDKKLFRSVHRPVEEVFFRRHGLLFLSVDELTELSDRLVAAQPLLGALARDVSLRGLLSSVDLALQGVEHGQAEVKDLAPLLEKIDSAAGIAATGKRAAPLSWDDLLGQSSARDQPRRFLILQPVLEYGQLEAGHDASQAIRAAADRLGIDQAHGMRLRLTGSVALSDANFATVAEGVEVSAPLMLGAVVLILFVAVRSASLVLAILTSLIVGLIATAGFAAATVGTLNPISVAFAVMFVGIAVDFAIQFVIRYRAERHEDPDPTGAMRRTAETMAAPLSVAALATAVGFLSFLPTQYTGVSQLGLIAGGGMVIALVIDFTLLPALLALVRPRAETAPVGLPLGFADRWLERRRRPVVAVAGVLALAGALLLPRLPFDFNPIHLQNPKAEAVSTFLDLARDPDNGSYAVDVPAKDRATASDLARKLDALPEVGRTMWLETFVPEQQDDKIAILADLANLLGPTLSPAEPLPAPTAQDLRQAMSGIAGRLEAVAASDPLAKGLAEHLKRVAAGDDSAILAFQDAVIGGLAPELDTLKRMLGETSPVTDDSLPADLVRAWKAPDGRMRVQASPKSNLQDEAELNRFVTAVQSVAPGAVGLPVSIEQSGRVVVEAFTQAGLAALVAIGLLLWLVLRRPLDALLVVLPLIAGALYTVIGCVVGGLAVNFANIIALPLLLGIGVAFNIYYVVNWRAGVADPLSSATTRAILFSALTTGTAFGSLAASPHLGTASMGFLLFLSLGLSVLTTFVLLPALFHLLGQRR